MNKKALVIMSLSIFLVSCSENNITETTKYQLTINFDSNKGTVSGGINGLYTKGTSFTFTATPNEGYELNGYYINNALVSDSSTYVFTLGSDTIINVIFDESENTDEPIENYYTLNINYDEEMGEVSGTPSGKYKENTPISLRFTPKEDYIYNGYKVNNSETIIHLDTYEFNITEDTTIDVLFSSSGEEVEHDYSYLYNNTIKPNRGSQSVNIDEYYEPVRGLKGEALKEGLHEIINDHISFSYTSSKKSWLDTDVLPSNSSNLYLFYQGSLPRSEVYSSSNREHVWAKSHGDFEDVYPMHSDYHNLHPSNPDVNQYRSNYNFGEVDTSKSYKDFGEDYGWSEDSMRGNLLGSGLNTSGTVFEPKDQFKGDVARTIFYMAVRYEGDNGEMDLEVNGNIDTSKYYSFTSGADGLHGNFIDLYNWATSGIDPVDDYEVHRNNIIDQDYQHNRNPFVDHPEFIIMIYDKNYNGAGALNDF